MKPIQNVTYWRDKDIKGVETCRVDNSRHAFPNHAHEGIYAIGLMERGGSYCLGPQKTESLVAAGEVALINPSQVHSGVPASGSRITYQMIYFDLDLMVTAAEDIFSRPSVTPEFLCMVKGDGRLWNCLQRLCRLLQLPGGRLEKESAILSTVAVLLPLCTNVAPTTAGHRRMGRGIRNAMELLAAELDRKLSLEEVAQAAGLSRYHFLRVFKRETGLSPHLFRTMRRIDRAKRLLREGRCLSEVALTVGFSDQSHFSNTFRKYTGATPGQYISESP